MVLFDAVETFSCRVTVHCNFGLFTFGILSICTVIKLVRYRVSGRLFIENKSLVRNLPNIYLTLDSVLNNEQQCGLWSSAIDFAECLLSICIFCLSIQLLTTEFNNTEIFSSYSSSSTDRICKFKLFVFTGLVLKFIPKLR